MVGMLNDSGMYVEHPGMVRQRVESCNKNTPVWSGSVLADIIIFLLYFRTSIRSLDPVVTDGGSSFHYRPCYSLQSISPTYIYIYIKRDATKYLP